MLCARPAIDRLTRSQRRRATVPDHTTSETVSSVRLMATHKTNPGQAKTQCHVIPAQVPWSTERRNR